MAESVRAIIQRQYTHLTNDAERTTAAAEENVLFALENLHSYLPVQRRLADGSLHLHGWFFKIATAELFAFDPEANQFLPLVREST
jgi:carbonic anhydrase